MTAQAITPETLPSIAWSNQPVITTELLADVYGTVTDNIKVNFNRNASRFIEGVHYFLLKGADLKVFKSQVTNSYPALIHKFTTSLYLWTERGAVRHAKILDTDKAWEVQAQLEDFYFSKKQPKQHVLTDYIKEPRQTLPAALPELLSANLTPLRKIIMLTLASKADKSGQVQIGIHNLASLCGIAKSTANETINSLEKMGFVSIIKTRHPNGGSLPNTYVIPERFRVVEGELVEPAILEHRPVKGMTSISIDDLNAKAIKWENLTDDMRYFMLQGMSYEGMQGAGKFVWFNELKEMKFKSEQFDKIKGILEA